jgi:outer membrane protein
MRSLGVCASTSLCTAVLSTTLLLGTPAWSGAVPMTLVEALDRAVQHTARGRILRGQADVAAQRYRAQRINYLVPEVSINGSVPAFDVDEDYRFFGGANTKQLYRTRDMSYQSFIEMKQSLVTGGSLTVTANLNAGDSHYPDTRLIGAGFDVVESLQRGYFDFRLDQPLFRPTSARKALHDLRDDREIADVELQQQEGDLLHAVTEAYLGVLRDSVLRELWRDRLEAAQVQAGVDSSKFRDGTLSEEQWLQSASARLDAELGQVDAETAADARSRQLALLLDLDANATVEPAEPSVPPPLADAVESRLRADGENTLSVRKGEIGLRKAQRQAEYAAAERRISGDLQARYSFGKGKVKTAFHDEFVADNIDTRSWGVLLKMRIPVWDGGASRATVNAARLQTEQARLEYAQQVKDARSEIASLLDDLDVSYRRLGILKRQIELAAGRMAIGESRYRQGEVTRVKFLGDRIAYGEQRDRYLEELTRYMTLRIDLEHRFPAR